MIQEAKQNVDLVQVVESAGVELTRRGNRLIETKKRLKGLNDGQNKQS